MLAQADRAILAAAELDREGRQDAATKLGLSSAQFHQRLTQILDDPAALEAEPVLVARLRRIRDRGRRARSRLNVNPSR